MRSFFHAASAAIIAASALAGLGQAQAEITSTPYGNVVAVHSGKCLAIEGASRSEGARVVQASCDGSDSRQLQLQAKGSGYYALIARGSGQCLVVTQDSKASGAQIVQGNCAAASATQWALKPVSGGYALQSKQSGMCLDVYSQSQSDGAALIQYACGGSGKTNQTFQFERKVFDEQTPVALMAQHSGQCVDNPGRSTNPGTQMIQYGCSGATNQQWKLQSVGDNNTMRVVGSNGLCLDVSGASKTAGGPVIQWSCGSQTNQQWRIEAVADTWRMVSVNSGMCLSVNAASQNPNATLEQQPCTGAKNQLWTVHQSTLQAKWSDVKSTYVDAVAAAHLPDGKILSWAANDRISFGGNGQTYTEVIDPVAGYSTQYLIADTKHDMFCPGTGMLPNGRIFVNGGQDSQMTSIYDPATSKWSRAADMKIPRGYQGSVVNPDGSVFTLGGSWSGGQGNKNGELWTPNNGWTLRPNITATPVLTRDQQGIFRADNHLWLQWLSRGRLLQAGPSKQMNWIDVTANGGRGSIVPAGLRGDDDDSMNGNLVPYATDTMLKVGGSVNYGDPGYYAPATRSAQIIDARNNGLSVERVAPMAYARTFSNSVALPNGQVMVVGGQTVGVPFSDDNSILVPELWDPVARVFERLPAMKTPRNYHSVALLLPDARVWSAGGGLCGGCNTNHLNYEIITPPYLLNADGTPAARPSILSASTSAPVGATITASVSEPVSSFALIRMSSVTHSVNNDQRRIALVAQSQDGRNYSLSLPNDAGTVVPGNYMLFAINANGVPSMAKTIQIAAR